MADVLDIEQDAMTSEEAWKRWPAERQSTLNRMREAARAEASRIEHSQVAWMIVGAIKQPNPSEVTRRDDMLGLYRLVDRILSDPDMMDRLRTYK